MSRSNSSHVLVSQKHSGSRLWRCLYSCPRTKTKEKFKRADAWNKFGISMECEGVLSDASCFVFLFQLRARRQPAQNFWVGFWVEPDKCYGGTRLWCSPLLGTQPQDSAAFSRNGGRLIKRQIRCFYQRLTFQLFYENEWAGIAACVTEWEWRGELLTDLVECSVNHDICVMSNLKTRSYLDYKACCFCCFLNGKRYFEGAIPAEIAECRPCLLLLWVV